MPIPRVLFVDDNFICNLDIREYLLENGFAVEAVYCAAAALEVIDRQVRLSALVTDIDLGPGLDGFEVSRCARASHPGLPVVYISAMGPGRHALEGVAGSEFIAKPFPARAVIEALDRLFHLEAAA